jgi:hypothetical protein
MQVPGLSPWPFLSRWDILSWGNLLWSINAHRVVISLPVPYEIILQSSRLAQLPPMWPAQSQKTASHL